MIILVKGHKKIITNTSHQIDSLICTIKNDIINGRNSSKSSGDFNSV